MADSLDQAHESTNLSIREKLTNMTDSPDLAHENGRFPGPSSRKWQIPSTKLTEPIP